MSAVGNIAKSGLHIGAVIFLKKFTVPLILILVIILGAFLILGSIIGGVTGGGSAANASTCRSVGGASASGDIRAPGDIRAQQVRNAKLIDEGVAELGYSGQVSRLVIIAAFGESTLENIDYGDDIRGVRNSDGSLTSSIGVLQQQEWWGTREERMNPKIAAQLFILGPKRQGGGLADIPSWDSLPESQAINRVQKNSNPDHYTASISHADSIIAEAGIDTSRKGKAHGENQSNAPETEPIKASNACAGIPGGNADAENTYPWGEHGDGGIVTPPDEWVADSMGFFYGECTSYAMWKVNEYLGGDMNNLKYTNGSGAKLGDGYQWREGWEARGWKVTTRPTANSVAWWGANGASGIGPYGHVAWVDSVDEDGSFIISEYNNSFLAPPGHKYSKREPITVDDSSAPNAFLIPPGPSK